MEVKSELVDAQFEMIIDEAALAALTVKISKVVFVLSSQITYIGTTAGWVRLGGGGALGDVKHSALDPADFATENGATWIIADGRDVTGSDYHSLTALTTVPDYRGVFLRGKNESRADGFADPAGEKVVGTDYADTTAVNGVAVTGVGDHSHSMPFGAPKSSPQGMNNSSSGPSNNQGTVTGNAGAHTHALTGDVETSPNHGITYIYIKINR